jgi:hypothetical protein
MTQSAYTSHNEIQTGMYAKIAPGGVLDATLANLGLLAVYDLWAVPQNAPFDYLTIGDGHELANDTLGPAGAANGFYDYAIVHIWSRQRGTQNPDAMVSRLNQLLHRQALTLPTLTHVSTLYQRTTYMADPDGLTLHIAIQYLSYSVQ